MRREIEMTGGSCPACGHAVVTTSFAGAAGDHRLTVHVHARADESTLWAYDRGPELGSVAIEQLPGDT